MGHHHNHSHNSHGEHDHDHSHDPKAAGQALKVALGINFLFFLTELVGGFMTGSLALLSDAAHMFADVAALGLSVFALWIAQRRSNPSKTYGYYRAEVLAAFLNSLSLWLMVAWIFIEAYGRLNNPAPVHSSGMFAIALAGLIANLVSAGFLHKHSHDDLSIRSSYIHLLSDTLGSVAVVIASVVIMATGNTLADPIASFLVGLLTLLSSWGLMKEAVDILMESTPRGIDTEKVRASLKTVSGVVSIHDLHIWSLGSRNLALSAHAVIAPGAKHSAVLADFKELLSHTYSIEHMTIQLEEQAHAAQAACDGCESEPVT